MAIFIFFRSHQKDLYERIQHAVPEAQGFENLYTLPEEVHQKRPQYLIIASQPDSETQKALALLPWEAIFVYEGVRWEVKAQAQSFDHIVQLQALIEGAGVVYQQALKTTYLEQLMKQAPLSGEALEHLEQLSGTKKKLRSKKRIRPDRASRAWTGVITVSGDGQLAAKLARELASVTQKKVLIVDANLMTPSLDYHFGIQKIQTQVSSHIKGIDNTGINIALDALVKNIMLEDSLHSIVHRLNANLYCMLGNYNIYNYEHYEEAQLKKFILTLKSLFDIVILNASDSLYDCMSLLSMHLSDLNVIVVGECIESIRHARNAQELLVMKQKISKNKQVYLKKGIKGWATAFPDDMLKAILGAGYLGTIEPNSNAKALRSICMRLITYAEEGRLKWG